MTDEEKYGEKSVPRGNAPFYMAKREEYRKEVGSYGLRQEKETKGEIIEQTEEIRVLPRSKATSDVGVKRVKRTRIGRLESGK